MYREIYMKACVFHWYYNQISLWKLIKRLGGHSWGGESMLHWSEEKVKESSEIVAFIFVLLVLVFLLQQYALVCYAICCIPYT